MGLPFARAHHGPEEMISQLTKMMEAEGPETKLLVRRADEWRILGKLTESEADYQLAIENQPKNRAALLGLAKVRLLQDRFDEAIGIAESAIGLAGDRESLGPFYAMIAKAHVGKHRDELALAAWGEAIDCDKPEVDWLLEHARVLHRLGRHTVARDFLEKAKKSNRSFVLHRAWIDALIRCRDFGLAEKHIDAGLQNARWQSFWLLQRAQMRVAQGYGALARADAQSALGELEKRIMPNVENPILEKQRQAALQLIDVLDAETSHSVSSNS